LSPARTTASNTNNAESQLQSGTAADSALSSRIKTDSLSGRLPCLDGIRAVAIVAVLVSHVQPTLHLIVPHYVDVIWRSLGRLGVNLFFGLSGFLITYLLKIELDRNGFISLKKFYARRMLRILPAFWTYMALFIALNLIGLVHIEWREIFASLFFYRNYVNADFKSEGWYVGHIWTLALEEQFYLLWPPLVAVLGAKKVRKLALIVALLMPLMRLAAYFYFNTNERGLIITMFHTSADRILWGCLLALYYDHPFVNGMIARFRNPMWLVAVAFFYFVVDPFLLDRWTGTYYLPLGMSLGALNVAFAIAWLSSNTQSVVAKMLNLPLIMAIGVLSYSLYLWQQPFFYGFESTPINHFPINLVGAVVAGFLSYTLIEKRALRWKAHFRA
jgi:peptidoglycan/LPS O-acetylase OafA/YrhL